MTKNKQKEIQNQGAEVAQTEVPVNVLDSITLEKLIVEAITEHAESRTKRYEVYKNRDNNEYKPNFLRVCRTYARLAKVRRPNATIKLVDKYGEERLLNAQAYQCPDFLYDVVNYSGRVYLCDEDRENENYITEATREASTLTDAELDAQMLSPEDLLAFWRDYNSTTSDSVKLLTLTKNAIAFSDLAGLVKEDEAAKSGYVYMKFKETGAAVTMTTIQARMVEFEALSMCGTETQTIPVGALVHRIAGTKPVNGGQDSGASVANQADGN